MHNFKRHKKENVDSEWDVLKRLLLELDISIQEKNLVLARFSQIYNYIEERYKNVKFFYNYSKVFLSIASVLNPALLSITTNTEDTMYKALFWFVWTSQIIVSLVTTFITFFKWDKKYFMYMTYKQRVEQEIWMFLELTGKYNIVHPLNEQEVSLMHTTHQSKIKYFLLKLEKLYQKIKESNYNIESVDNENKDQQSVVKTHRNDGKMLRQKVMNHKIDSLLDTLKNTDNIDMQNEIKKNIQRLQKLQEQNQLTELQLKPSPGPKQSPVPLDTLEQEIEKNQDKWNPR